MISKIHIKDLATYTGEGGCMLPNKINMVYGGNGSGKSTLAKYLKDHSISTNSKIIWENNRKIPVLIYNNEFIVANFNRDDPIKGIFTLGEESKEAREFIATKQGKIDDNNKKIDGYNKNIEDLNTNKQKKVDVFYERCWNEEKRYGETFSKALVGSRGSKTTFAIKCLKEYENFDENNVSSLDDIKSRYIAAFDNDNKREYDTINKIDVKEISDLEKCPLLMEVITGTSDSEIGELIKYLNNSDWVRQGVSYAEKSNGKCPYCQCTLDSSIQKEIKSFFDEAFDNKYNALKNMKEDYISHISSYLEKLYIIINTPIPGLDYNDIEQNWERLSTIFNSNKIIIENKITFPSKSVDIESVIPIFNIINDNIDNINVSITKNNAIIHNLKNEKEHCKTLIWQYLVNELKNSITEYKREMNGFEKGEDNLTKIIGEKRKIIREIEKEISEKQKNHINVTKTVKDINDILKNVGFCGFELNVNPDDEYKNTYRIIRPNGDNAHETLSDGERNFITFLYFYYLIQGQSDPSNLENDKIVIVDDPISSLDSGVLFIVSTLVRNLFKYCKDNNFGIHQVFVLTHNVYFHKEVAYRLAEDYPNIAGFWMVKKEQNISKIENKDKDPIENSYALLWSEIQDTSNNSPAIQNTLRRILDSYFKIIGNVNYHKVIDKFEGKDKIICRSLLSYLDAGSHGIFDDLYISPDSESVQRYLEIFKQIFVKLNQSDHYYMMMKESVSTNSSDSTSEVAPL